MQKISLSVQTVANGLHVALGALLVLLPLHLWGFSFWQCAAAVLGAGAVKEVCDMWLETPETSGGVKGGIEDFAGYLAGVIGLWVILTVVPLL